MTRCQVTGASSMQKENYTTKVCGKRGIFTGREFFSIQMKNLFRVLLTIKTSIKLGKNGNVLKGILITTKSMERES